jgi:hypothetical protein
MEPGGRDGHVRATGRHVPTGAALVAAVHADSWRHVSFRWPDSCSQYGAHSTRYVGGTLRYSTDTLRLKSLWSTLEDDALARDAGARAAVQINTRTRAAARTNVNDANKQRNKETGERGESSADGFAASVPPIAGAVPSSLDRYLT